MAFLQQIERSTPAGLDLHVILDNSSTHKGEGRAHLASRFRDELIGLRLTRVAI